MVDQPYMVLIIMSLYGVISYHVSLSEGHMIANHPIYGGDWLSCDRGDWPSCNPLRGSHSSSAGTVFIRQNLTFTDIRFRRIKTAPALKGLSRIRVFFLFFEIKLRFERCHVNPSV